MAKKKYADRTCCVIDNGLFVELALRLARDFGRVLYAMTWVSAYPAGNARLIGSGIEGVERVLSPWPHFDDIDIFVFPDVYEGDLQDFLVSRGKRVWGCRSGEFLEIDRVASKEHTAELGIDIGNYTVLNGLDELRQHLKTHNDQWVKVSATRGDFETWHAENFDQVEPQLDELEHSLGAKKKIMEFIVEDAINPAIEIGYDGYTIDGKFAKNALLGVEKKDKAYVGQTMRYDRIPQRIREVNDKLAPTLKQVGYRGFISTELRCTDNGKAYLVDPCCRAASPPNEVYQIMVDNLAEIIWEGADGIVVEPEFNAKYAAQVFLLSDWASKNWQQVEFPPQFRDNVKLRNLLVIDGNTYAAPTWSGIREFGAVVATGNTAKAAIEECKRIAELVKGHEIEKPLQELDEAAAELKEVLGPEPAPPSKLQRDAEALRSKGRISQKAYEKMVAKAS